jgi:hypothetical protein
MLVELQRFKGSIFFSMVWPAMPSFSIGRQVRVEVGTAISDLLAGKHSSQVVVEAA